MKTQDLEINPKYRRRARPLNKFGQWAEAHDLNGPALDQALNVSRNHSYAYTVALDHPKFSVPRPLVMARIVALTDGAIQPNDFYDLTATRAAA